MAIDHRQVAVRRPFVMVHVVDVLADEQRLPAIPLRASGLESPRRWRHRAPATGRTRPVDPRGPDRVHPGRRLGPLIARAPIVRPLTRELRRSPQRAPNKGLVPRDPVGDAHARVTAGGVPVRKHPVQRRPGAVSPRLSGVAVDPVLWSTPILVNDEIAVVAPPADATPTTSTPTTTQAANNDHQRPLTRPEPDGKRRP